MHERITIYNYDHAASSEKHPGPGSHHIRQLYKIPFPPPSLPTSLTFKVTTYD